jgi:hypothetical protein
LECFAPLAELRGVQLYSLQKHAGREELAAFVKKYPIIDLAEQLEDFCDTAAAMTALDLVISCDSAPAHLAGALGKPVWVALPHVADWRWLLSRADSPWYPTMRLFRQPVPGSWQPVFQEMATQLAQLLRGSA